MNNTAARKSSPVRTFADGQHVRVMTTKGAVTGTVVSAMVVGVRHPGHVYEVRRDDTGTPVYAPTGLLTAI